ncbi:DUF305 domain-containing protein [Edwardsiella hoshinae]|uniref:DUF305 domain-containing protein n=1 Tax=Edwardsiella hoshinae TaxID=93378 RepID=A0A376DE12_9GAMM|nr:DUF305 domain-containing protein [Edwardsiella hoshinae]AOV96813.1 DUF305 domain-containing protein [Edwardsiella hoshinae]QPR27313.1 DUF305 domain-containing protein [Edwardsiella hoshinae]STC87767.1 Uncharacterized protein conserved in bacteria [Edwardsiella hoshinae]
MKKLTVVGALVLAACATSAVAATLPAAQAETMHQELNSAMNGMHESMMKGMMSNDADVAFAAGMIPHHIGAVEMAKIELKYGTDPQMRKLAKDIIAAQDKEIKEMKAWLAAHPDQGAQTGENAHNMH